MRKGQSPWRHKTFGPALCLVALALLGVLLVALSTRWGAGPSPDSAGYISIARNLLSGQGYRGLHGGYATVWPPLYPLVLALVGLFGPDPLVAARWINVALFGANVVLVGLILRRYARVVWLPILASFLVMTSVDLVQIHSMIWTEPLFILFGLLALVLIAAYAERQTRGLLVASLAAVAVATLTRYTGFSLIATGMGIVFYRTRRSFPKKMARTMLFGLGACVPALCWMIRNILVAGTSAGRGVGFHPITSHRIQSGLKTLSLWLLPESVPLSIRISAMIVVLAGIALVALTVGREPGRPEPNRRPCRLPSLPLVMGVFIIVYIAQLVVSISFIDRETPLDFRILAPVHSTALILALCLADRLLREPKLSRILKLSFIIVLVLFAVLCANRTVWWVNWTHQDGLGYASTRWRDSELVTSVRELDPNVRVYTNAGDVTYLLADRTASVIPAKFDYWTGKPNKHFFADVAGMKGRLENEGAVVVYFERVRGRGHLASRDDLEELLPLRVRTQVADGVIYEIAR